MKNYIPGLVLLTILFSCTNNDTKTTGSTDSSTNTIKKDSVYSLATVELASPVEQNIYNGYIALKNSLVATKYEDSKKLAAALAISLKAREGCENTAVTAERIASAKDIIAQRKEFTAVSSDLIALFKHAGIKKGSIYVQHCPMANNGNGGDWLASESKIQNPYYGDEMMECGAVVEEIKTTKEL